MKIPCFHAHSEYSFLASLLRVENIVEFSAVNRLRSACLCDTLSTYGFFELTKLCEAEGLKPVYGIQLFASGVRGQSSYPVLFFALNHLGIHHLFELNSLSHSLFRETGSFALPFSEIAARSQHLACFAADEFLHHAKDDSYLKELSGLYLDTFRENFFLEMNYRGQASVPEIKSLIEIAENFALTPIATSEARYIDEKSSEAFAFLNAQREVRDKKNERGKRFDPKMDFSFKFPERMEKTFANHPEYLQNAVDLLGRIDTFLDLKSFKIPKTYQSPLKLAEDCRRNLQILFGRRKAKPTRSLFVPESEYLAYEKRMEHELELIHELGLEEFFLIVADIARFMRNRHIPFGPGRGSSVSSLVLFLLGVTRIDPIQYGLTFERFLNRARKELPDVDIDVCHRRRNEVFDYISEKFGDENCVHLATVGREKVRSVLRETAKSFRLNPDKLKQILSALPKNYWLPRLNTLLFDEAYPLKKLYENDKEIRDFLNIAVMLEGIPNHSSLHAGGVLILPRGITQFASIETTARGERVAQLTKDDMEKTGFIKIDLLGLRFITILSDTAKKLDLGKIPEKDEKALSLLAAADTTAVFQLESAGMRALLRKIKPKNIKEISDVISLYRPGPMKSGMTEEYLRRHSGKADYSIPPHLLSITGESHGLFIYQEQILRLAHETAEMSWEDADRLRKALSSRKRDVMEPFREKFLSGCRDKGIDTEESERLFSIIQEFGSYAFNKAHSTAYAKNAYDGAYMKAHYPLEFYQSSFNNNIGFSRRLNDYLADLKYHGFKAYPPCVNRGLEVFSLEEDGIRVGLSQVKYCGKKLASRIIRERKNSGDFSGIENFLFRMKGSGLTGNALEHLVAAGAFDFSGYPRGGLLEHLSEIRVEVENRLSSGELFDEEPIRSNFNLKSLMKNAPDDRSEDLFLLEQKSMSLFVSQHPVEIFREERKDFDFDPIGEIRSLSYGVFIAYLFHLRETETKNGAKMAFSQISDETGVAEAVFFPKTYRVYKNTIQNRKVVLLKGEISDGKLFVEECYLFEKLIEVKI